MDSTGFAGAPNEKLGGAALGVELASVACSAGFPKRLGVDGAVVLENWSESRRGERRHGTYAVGPAAAPKRLVAGFTLRTNQHLPTNGTKTRCTHAPAALPNKLPVVVLSDAAASPADAAGFPNKPPTAGAGAAVELVADAGCPNSPAPPEGGTVLDADG